MPQYKYSTLAVHAGQQPDPLTGAVNVPVYLSSTFELTGIGADRGYDYSRAGNPTRDRLETALAALEGGMSGHAFTTGMAAIAALVAMLRAGDHIVCSRDVYAGTVRLFDRIVSGYGIQIEYVDTSSLCAVEAAMKPNTKLVHIETPSNPLMVLTDIAGVVKIAHARGVEVSVDNTFLSPALQRPIERRTSSLTEPCVVVAECEASDSTPPSDSALMNILMAFRNRSASARDLSSKLIIEPKPFCCFMARSYCGCDLSPG